MLGNKIKYLRDQLDISQEELAKRINISPSTIAMYETNKRQPSYEILLKLAEIFNCSLDYLLGKKENSTNKNSAIVLVYGTIPAGIPMEMIEDVLDTEEISAEMLKGGKEYFGLRIKGDSMFPEYLDGDTIILEKVEDVENGQDAVVMINGDDGTFKRVFKNENGIILQPLNASYSPLVFSNKEIKNKPVKIIGKVVELRRKK